MNFIEAVKQAQKDGGSAVYTKMRNKRIDLPNISKLGNVSNSEIMRKYGISFHCADANVADWEVVK